MMPRTPWWASFPFRVSAGVFLALVLLTVALTWAAHQRLVAGQAALVESAAHTQTSLLRNAVIPGLIFGDVAMLDELMTIAAGSALFVSGELRDAFGAVLVRVGEADASAVELWIEEPIVVNGRTLGTMTLGFDDAMLRATSREASQHLVMIAALVTLLSLGVAVFLARWTTRRLERLRDAGLRIQQGDLDFAIPVTGRDEISGLERVLNYAVSALVASREQLERTARDEAQAHARLRALQTEVGAVLWEASPDTGEWLFVSGDVQRVFGLRPDELCGDDGVAGPFVLRSLAARLERVLPVDRERVREAWTVTRPASAVEYRWQTHPEAPVRWLRDQFAGQRPRAQDPATVDRAVRGITFDVTEMREAGQRLAASERRLQRIVTHLSEGLFELDGDATIRVCNPAFERMVGWSEAALRGRPLTSLLHSEDQAEFVALFGRLLSQTGRAETVEFRLAPGTGQTLAPPPSTSPRSRDGGRTRWVRMSGVSFEDNGRLGVIGTWVDITVRRESELEIRRLAFFDVLTGLPNRSLLRDRVAQAIARAQRQGSLGAVLFLDLDHFKDVNDLYGHAIGDRLLCNLAGVLASRIRRSDTVARLGGDEFVVLLTDLGDDRDQASIRAERVAQELLQAVRSARLMETASVQPLARDARAGTAADASDDEPRERRSEPVPTAAGDADGEHAGVPGRRSDPVAREAVAQLQQSLSVGIALFGGDDADLGDDPMQAVDEVFRRADLAMYQAKSAGRGCVRHFDASLHSALTTRVEIEGDLRVALREREGLVLYFQQICALDGEVSGAEALLRWRHPRRGLLLPGTFIALAERAGLIVDIGLWVLDEAVARLEAWAQEPALRDDYLSINVSAAQLRDSAFEARLREHVARGRFPPSHLRIELTESVFLEHRDAVVERMSRIADLGVRWILDDFGTGYSSLSYLTRLPLHGLKIDRSFVQQATRDHARAAVVTTIVRLANALGLEVVAEGVEERSELMLLAELGCRRFQGYLLGDPVDESRWLDERRACRPPESPPPAAVFDGQRGAATRSVVARR